MTPNQTALLSELRTAEAALVARLDELEAVSRNLAAIRFLIERIEPQESQTKASVGNGATEPSLIGGTADSMSGEVSRRSHPAGGGCNVVMEDVTAGETALPPPAGLTPSEPEESDPGPQETAFPDATEHDPYADEIASIERRRRERDALLTELWPTDLTVTQIGERLGMHASSVSTRAKAIGLPTRLGRNRRDEPALKVDREVATDDDDDAPGVAIAPASVAGASTALMDLPAEGCKWPIGEPGTEGFHFCGKARGDGRDPYCEGHQRMARLRR